MPGSFLGDFNDPHMIHKFGNMNLTSSLEFTVAARPYVEPASEAQRSIISTSVQDKQPGGTGARRVRVVYLDSNYVRHQEDVDMSGTVGNNTVGSDIRFIEDFYVIEGSNAVGNIMLRTGLQGTGSDITNIGPGTTQAFMCHHYVPSGSTCYIMGWGATVDREANMRLRTQFRSGSFLVDDVADLDKLYGLTGLFSRLSFDRPFRGGMKLDPMTYVRVTVQPSGTYSSTTRCYLDLWEDPPPQ